MQEAAILRAQAAKCRALAGEILDKETSKRLLEIAADYEERAREIEQGPDAEPPAPDQV